MLSSQQSLEKLKQFGTRSSNKLSSTNMGMSLGVAVAANKLQFNRASVGTKVQIA
jgi:hypothetical protein